MSVQRLDIYDSGRLRVYEHWRIYALFCMRTKTDAVVKIGVSSIIYDRLLQLQAGLPFRIGVCLHSPAGDRSMAMRLEKALHNAFKARNTRGEWFEFDLSDAASKDEFHEKTKAAYKRVVGAALCWKKITEGQLRAYSGMRDREAEERKKLKAKSWAA